MALRLGGIYTWRWEGSIRVLPKRAYRKRQKNRAPRARHWEVQKSGPDTGVGEAGRLPKREARLMRQGGGCDSQAHGPEGKETTQHKDLYREP